MGMTVDGWLAGQAASRRLGPREDGGLSRSGAGAGVMDRDADALWRLLSVQITRWIESSHRCEEGDDFFGYRLWRDHRGEVAHASKFADKHVA